MDYAQKKLVKQLERGDTHGGFDRHWVVRSHALLMQFLNIRSFNPDTEWQDLQAFFLSARRLIEDYKVPRKKTAVVVRKWQRYLRLTRLLAVAKTPADWRRINQQFPSKLVDRAHGGGPFQKIDDNYINHPLDAIWGVLGLGQWVGIQYRRCATPECERYAAATWPKKPGRQPRYCEQCDPSYRAHSRYARRKEKGDKDACTILRRALDRLPAKDRKISDDRYRRQLANRLYGLVKKELAKLPGDPRAAKWISKKLKKEMQHGQTQD